MDTLHTGRVALALQRLFEEADEADRALEPCVAAGAPILAENAFDQDDNAYLAYVRDPANGYVSQTVPVSPGRGNEFTVYTR
ncbi:hypothetical protein [Achromobacter aloeverae]